MTTVPVMDQNMGRIKARPLARRKTRFLRHACIRQCGLQRIVDLLPVGCISAVDLAIDMTAHHSDSYS
jgi:hypothetical protein